MNAPISILLAVAGIGGQLGIAGDKLRMLLPPDCSPELKDAIRQCKAGLIELLKLDFLIVQSDALNSIVFWTPDDMAKEALVAAGADAGSIYSAAELALLVNHRVTSGELPTIHTARAKFGGRLTGS